jgi:hypothetical protein
VQAAQGEELVDKIQLLQVLGHQDKDLLVEVLLEIPGNLSMLAAVAVVNLMLVETEMRIFKAGTVATAQTTLLTLQ